MCVLTYTEWARNENLRNSIRLWDSALVLYILWLLARVQGWEIRDYGQAWLITVVHYIFMVVRARLLLWLLPCIRLAGDLNDKTPTTIPSVENKMGYVFKSSRYSNYKGVKIQYIVSWYCVMSRTKADKNKSLIHRFVLFSIGECIFCVHG